MGKRHEEKFHSREYIYMKRCSISLDIKKVPSKIMMRYYYTYYNS